MSLVVVVIVVVVVVVVVLLSIYKMFPADKKRVESALASAHLPKGKVRVRVRGEELLRSLCDYVSSHVIP